MSKLHSRLEKLEAERKLQASLRRQTDGGARGQGRGSLGSILLFNDRNPYKNNLAKQRDLIAEPIDPRVGITDREIRVDSSENIIH